jgi:hypothetical protein
MTARCEDGCPRPNPAPPAVPVTAADLEKRGELTMNTNPALLLQAYIIGVLVFLISITAITEHPEWFN